MLAAEIKATALEAQGDDTHAAGAYAHRVALLSRGMPLVDETQIPGLREWWVGHAYAQCVIRSGQSLAVRTSLQENVRASQAGSDIAAIRAARMLLAFLLDEEGKQDLAQSEWRRVATPAAPKSAATLPAAIAGPSTKTGI